MDVTLQFLYFSISWLLHCRSITFDTWDQIVDKVIRTSKLERYLWFEIRLIFHNSQPSVTFGTVTLTSKHEVEWSEEWKFYWREKRTGWAIFSKNNPWNILFPFKENFKRKSLWGPVRSAMYGNCTAWDVCSCCAMTFVWWARCRKFEKPMMRLLGIVFSQQQ